MRKTTLIVTPEEYSTRPRPVVPAQTWTQRVLDAGRSLNELLPRNTVGSLVATVTGTRPGSEYQPRPIGWLRAGKSGKVAVKFRQGGWEALMEVVDPEHDVLTLMYGNNDSSDGERWIVSLCPKTAIPPRAVKRSCIVRLRNLIVFIPQKEHVLKLNGMALLIDQGEVTIG